MNSGKVNRMHRWLAFGLLSRTNTDRNRKRERESCASDQLNYVIY